MFSKNKTLRMPDQVNVIMDQPGLSKHGRLSRRHRKKMNPTFTDGHAESLRTERRKLSTRKCLAPGTESTSLFASDSKGISITDLISIPTSQTQAGRRSLFCLSLDDFKAP